MSRFKKVFVICPSNLVTGGPDALHQMVYYLNQLSINASIVYINLSERKSNVKIPEPYRCYVDNFLFEKDIIDSSEYAVIIPESLTYFHKKFSNATVFIWWLGVENHLKYSFSYKLFFTMTYPLRVLKNINHYRGKIFKTISWMWDRNIYGFSNEQQNIKHICASYYAFDYVSAKTSKQTYLCIEPISKLFLTEYEKRKYNSLPRLDQVIYNPIKSGVYVDKLIKKYKGIKFIPLRNMTQEELIYQYQTSKGDPYLDFGTFGVVLVSFFLGIFLNYIYNKNLYFQGKWTIIYATLANSILISFYSYTYSLTYYIYIILFLIFFVKKRRNTH